jgi:hypothetical protein
MDMICFRCLDFAYKQHKQHKQHKQYKQYILFIIYYEPCYSMYSKKRT